MARFATSARLAAWAGLAPGDNESAGKRKHAAARQGNRHLRAAMTESAWATARAATCMRQPTRAEQRLRLPVDPALCSQAQWFAASDPLIQQIRTAPLVWVIGDELQEREGRCAGVPSRQQLAAALRSCIESLSR